MKPGKLTFDKGLKMTTATKKAPASPSVKRRTRNDNTQSSARENRQHGDGSE